MNGHSPEGARGEGEKKEEERRGEEKRKRGKKMGEKVRRACNPLSIRMKGSFARPEGSF